MTWGGPPFDGSGLRLLVDGREVLGRDLERRRDNRSWRLEGEGLAVDAVVEVLDGRTLTTLTISGRGHVARVDAAPCQDAPGPGHPALGDGWFAALEHPGADGFGLAVDHDLATGPLHVPPLVLGHTAPGLELSALWDEVDRVRARPPGLIVLANNWYQLGYAGRMEESTVAAELDGFARLPVDLDFYCLDDPWDGNWTEASGLWGRMDPARFPRSLAPLHANGTGIGLWVSPWGGYFDRHDARVAWGRDHGFEVHEGSWPRLCPAGDRYGRHLRESMSSFTAAGVRYWKIDGVQFDCPSTAHGHATGAAGTTDQMDRFASLLAGVRAVDPSTVLTFTSGSNPSPWWLKHADFVWRGGLDDDAPAEFDGGRHERFATYIDSCLDALRGSGVPVSSIVAFSLVENGAVGYREEGDGPDAWARHCWLIVGRGTHHHDLYVAPDSLTSREWDALAGALRWARAHQRVLARSRMVGGRPQAGEPYGFLSTDNTTGEAIVCLRNPSARAQPVAIDLGGQLTDVEQVFGRGARWPVGDLDPFEVVVVSGRWRPGTRPGPRG